MSSVQPQDEKGATETTGKTRAHELRNAELVSRLLAATPPYLYSALPLQPHAFFFSEMLRSFVNARHGCRPPHYHRRFKRRPQKYFSENENEPWQRRNEHWSSKDDEKKDPETLRPEVPLELTVDKHTRRFGDLSPHRISPKPELTKSNGSPGPPGRPSSFVDVGTEEGLAKPSPCVGRPSEVAFSPSNLILPPPPPMWYPPIYNPQFGVDPLNFFIDLRVSGHIYDRKRAMTEGLEPNINQEMRSEEHNTGKGLGREIGQRQRHLSAFSVPVRSSPICVDGPAKYFDNSVTNKINFGGKNNGTSYIMRNLKTLYENVKSTRDDNRDKKIEKEDTKVESSDIEDDIIE